MNYWLTVLNQGSTRSPYSTRLTLLSKPDNENKILTWLGTTFDKSGYLYKVIDYPAYAEIYFKNECDATSFMLIWGDSLTAIG